MKNIPERQKDILSIISSLDISPTMYKNAVEKYSAITKFLNDYGIDADMYPQGSVCFRNGNSSERYGSLCKL